MTAGHLNGDGKTVEPIKMSSPVYPAAE
jgi:hypothetical protein